MQTLWVDPYNGLKTYQNDIIFDRGMSFEAACRKLEHEKGADDASGFRRSRRPIFGRTMFLLALQKLGTPGVFSICRPNTGTSFFDMEVMPQQSTVQACYLLYKSCEPQHCIPEHAEVTAQQSTDV